MSKYNQFEILYSNGYTTFSPRPRLTDNAMGGEMMVGDIGSPDKTIGFSFSHHLDENFTIKSGLLFTDMTVQSNRASIQLPSISQTFC